MMSLSVNASVRGCGRIAHYLHILYTVTQKSDPVHATSVRHCTITQDIFLFRVL